MAKEELVEMDGVDVVAGHDIQHNLQRMLLNLGFAGIQPQVLSEPFCQIRTPLADVIGSNSAFVGFVEGAIGIEPRVQLKSALMSLGDSKSERVVEWRRRLSHGARQILRPRFQ